MIHAEILPAVLEFPHNKQSALSTVRALKNALTVLETMTDPKGLLQEDQVQVAIDDLTLMLHAIK